MVPEKTGRCQALVIWYFLLRPRADETRGFLLMNFLISHRTRKAHNQSLTPLLHKHR